MATATAELAHSRADARASASAGCAASASGLLLLWSLFPVYWALNTSLQTNAQATEQPADLVPDALRVQ